MCQVLQPHLRIRALKEWPELFGNPLLASAGLDRLTHKVDVVVITGSSFRPHGPGPRAKVKRSPRSFSRQSLYFPLPPDHFWVVQQGRPFGGTGSAHSQRPPFTIRGKKRKDL